MPEGLISSVKATCDAFCKNSGGNRTLTRAKVTGFITRLPTRDYALGPWRFLLTQQAFMNQDGSS
jgi:hypothetical protein